jgi:hypothetical protein
LTWGVLQEKIMTRKYEDSAGNVGLFKDSQVGSQENVLVVKPKPVWDRCYNFLNIFAEKFSEKLAFLTQNKAKL